MSVEKIIDLPDQAQDLTITLEPIIHEKSLYDIVLKEILFMYEDDSNVLVELVKLSSNKIKVTIIYKTLTISNTKGGQHKLLDLMVTFTVEINDKKTMLFCRDLRGARLKRTAEEISCGYSHSHLPGRTTATNLQSFCLGSSDLGMLLSSYGDTDTYLAQFLLTLESFLKHESLSGGPYRLINDVKRRRTSSQELDYTLLTNATKKYNKVYYPINSVFVKYFYQKFLKGNYDPKWLLQSIHTKQSYLEFLRDLEHLRIFKPKKIGSSVIQSTAFKKICYETFYTENSERIVRPIKKIIPANIKNAEPVQLNEVIVTAAMNNNSLAENKLVEYCDNNNLYDHVVRDVQTLVQQWNNRQIEKVKEKKVKYILNTILK